MLTKVTMSVSVHLNKTNSLNISTKDRARFGWLTIEGADIPYIVRGFREKFVPVKMVEKYLLCFYPSNYPDELEGKPPLVCTFAKQEEVDLLNKCCSKKPGFVDMFNTSDPVVKLNDFLEFFGVVKKAYPNVVIGAKTTPPPAPTPPKQSVDFGWVLIRDAMIPYVVRNGTRFAPVNVIRGAAQLLIGAQVESTSASEAEVDCLNTMCQKVGLNFTFQSNTNLTSFRVLASHEPNIKIQDLPRDNPMEYVNAAAGVLDNRPRPAQANNNSLTTTASKTSANQNINQHGKGGKKQAQGTSASRSLQALASMAKGQETCSSRPPSAAASTGVNGQAKKKAPVKTQTKAVAAASNNTDKEGKVEIKAVECYGKTISCLIRGRSVQAFALVEAVCRVYFPNSSLVDFIHFLEIDLAVTLYVLKKSEEDAFIQFYGIPTKQLRCNQVIKLKDLRDRMTRLQARFGSFTPPGSVSGEQCSTDGNSKSGSPSPQLDNVDSPLHTTDTTRSGNRSSPSSEIAAKGKSLKSLENAIMRLRDKKQGNSDPEDLISCDRSGTPDVIIHPEEVAEPDQSEAVIEAEAASTELQDDLAQENQETTDSDQGTRAPSTNKRKATWTPRRCSPQKKLTLIIDGVKTEIEENSSAGTEESDLEEYS